MTTARLPAAVRDLLRSAADARPDADLLGRFVATRDEAAFAELVRRHGGTVWDVCRAVLGNRADADDAFQAVFLTLARRADRLQKPGSVGAWLHGVAVRTSRKARAAAVRRTTREADALPPAAAEPADPGWAEVRAIVHDALAALPAVYREPLVACYLRGLTQDDTAAELGLSKAAVKKRLERGRDRLRAALTRRGLAPAVVPGAVAAAPEHLLAAAARLAAGAPVPESVLRLVEGGVSMTFAKLAASVVLAAGVSFAVAAQDGPAHSAAEQPPRPKAAAKAAAPKAAAQEAPAAPGTELTGTWTVNWVETSGEALYDGKTRDETLPAPAFVFSADRCQVKGLRVLHLRDFAYRLDPGKTPKEIDATMLDGPKRGELVVGIYLVRGDELRICLRLQRPDLGRPKGYVTNSGTTLYTFVLSRGSNALAPGTKSGAAAPPALRFDETLRAGNRLYLVLDGPADKSFPDDLAPFAQRLELAVKTAALVKDKDLSVVLFRRTDRQAGTGSYSGFTPAQLRAYAAEGPDRRVDKLAEHAWVLGRLPKDATPLQPPPPPSGGGGPFVPPVGPVPAEKAEQALTPVELARLVTGENSNPARAYGKLVEFTAKVESVAKGVDGGIVPFVKIEGWPVANHIYGRVYAHNVFPDLVGKAGDRVRVRGRVVSHAYGTLTVWAERWTREEVVAPAPKDDPAPEELSIYDRVHPKADLPGPGAEVRDPKDRSVTYYYTSSLRMWREPRNVGKHPGLYVSRDGGAGWKLRNTSFEFQTLFAHPQTGHLFAVVEHSWLGSDEKDGQLHRYHADKAITSADGGAKWRDITPPPGYIADINSFFPDPDHPNRACFVATIIRGIIFRPTDDRYSEYDRIHAASPEGQRLLERGTALVRP